MQATKSAKPAMHTARMLNCRANFMLFVLGTLTEDKKHNRALSKPESAQGARHGDRLYPKQHGGRYAEIRAGVYPHLFAKSEQTADNTGDRESLSAKE